MDILTAVFLGAFIGWSCPLVGRGPGIGTLLEMLVGAIGGLVGAALSLLIHDVPWYWLAWLGAALLLAIVGWGRTRVVVTAKPPAG